jgi:hypothetical protein
VYRLSVNGQDSGGAFAITDRIAITAAHVIRKASSPSDVTFSAEEILVSSFDRDERLDLAALILKEPVSPSAIAEAVKGDRWAIHVPPKPNDPYLSGIVDVTMRPFKNDSGYVQGVMQLRVHQAVKGFAGYSGSAIYLPELEDAVIAILTEQQLERTRKAAGSGKPSATNVLYAVPMTEVLRRFDLEGQPQIIPRIKPNVTAGAAAQISVIADLIAQGKSIIKRLEGHILPSGKEKIPEAVDQRVTYTEFDNWEHMIHGVISAGFSEVILGRYETIREVWSYQKEDQEGTEITRLLTRTKSMVSLLQDLEV